MFRIISGIYKGRRLPESKNTQARPTTDFAKEALFGILAHRIKFSDVIVLDLFAGLASISFEFASRNSKKIYCIENNRNNTKYITENINKFNLSEKINIINQDVFYWIKKNKETFDIIFADPPYELEIDNYNKLIDLILSENHLSDKGIFILEHSSRQKPIENNFYKFTRNYGNVAFSFYSKDENF